MFVCVVVVAAMAEERQQHEEQSEERVKLFVGQVPKHMTEAQLLEMFQEFAIIDEVNIIKDKITRASRGCIISISISPSILRSTVCNCCSMILLFFLTVISRFVLWNV